MKWLRFDEIIQGLADWEFKKAVTPTVIRFMYVLGCILAIGMTFYYVVLGFRTSEVSGVVRMIFAVVVLFLYVLLLRVVLEILMALFKGASAWSKASIDQEASEVIDAPEVEVIESVATEVTEKKKSVSAKKQD